MSGVSYKVVQGKSSAGGSKNMQCSAQTFGTEIKPPKYPIPCSSPV